MWLRKDFVVIMQELGKAWVYADQYILYHHASGTYISILFCIIYVCIIHFLLIKRGGSLFLESKSDAGFNKNTHRLSSNYNKIAVVCTIIALVIIGLPSLKKLQKTHND